MGEANRGTSRRGLLGTWAMVAAGALGLGAAARAEVAVPSRRESARSKPTSSASTVATSTACPRRAGPGEVPVKGERHSAYGELLDRPSGKVVGHFTRGAPHARLAVRGGASSLEIHTFALNDGTIHGSASAARGADGHFVILGGTGRYAGAPGSYPPARLAGAGR